MSPRIRDPENPSVRPRTVWAGVILAVLGLLACGIGIMALVPWLAWSGAGVMVTGLLAAWRGGAHFDVRAPGQQPTHDDPRAIRQGSARRGISPAARIVDADAMARAAAVTARKRVLLERSRASRVGSTRMLAAMGVLVVGAWLLLDQWFLSYPFTIPGQDGRMRDAGLIVILVLAALRLRLPTRSIPASTVCLLGGVGLVAAGCVDLGAPAVAINELLAGAVVVLLGGLSFT